MTDPLSQRVAATVRAELARKQIKQRDLAATLGVSTNQTSERLAGRIHFRLDELEAVAELLDVPVAYLLGTDASVGAA